MPEIEGVVEFTDEYRNKLFAEKKDCREGRLLIWNTEACFRDATGRWYFVTAFDQFHRSHPKGDRSLVKEQINEELLPKLELSCHIPKGYRELVKGAKPK